MKGDTTSSRLFKRILVAIDGSDQSVYAADLAAELAHEIDAQVVLVHVVSIGGGFNPELARVRPDVREQYLAAGESMLSQVKERIAPLTQADLVLRDGYAAEEIVAVATLFDIDLIVMGTHGRGRIGHAVLGSVANEVMRMATCPVLTVTHAFSRDPLATKEACNGTDRADALAAAAAQ